MANSIASLMRKDFCVLCSEKTTGLLFAALLALSAAFAYSLNFSSLVFVMFTASSYIMNIFGLEEKYRTETFFASLPVRRKDIVFARYGEVLAIAAAYFALAYLSNTISFYAGKTAVRLIPIGYCASVLLVLSFISSFTFPFYFKLGLAKAKIVTTLLFSGFMALFTAIMFAHPRESAARSAKIFSQLFNAPFPRDPLNVLLLLGCAILLWGASIPVAAAVYSRKNL